MRKRDKWPKRIPKEGGHCFRWQHQNGVTTFSVDGYVVIGETETHYLTAWRTKGK